MTTRRIILHPGFHKTGTTSLQHYLRDNAALFSDHFTYYGIEAFRPTASAARIYAERPFPWRIVGFRRQLRAFLASIPDDPVIVISCESFSGAMPGHRGLFGQSIRRYAPAAIPLGRVLLSGLRRRFGDEVEITLLYSVRQRDAWIKSVYGHLVRSIHLTEDLHAFLAGFGDLMDPAQEARLIASALPATDLRIVSLESVETAPEGPAAMVLDLVDFPTRLRARLPRAQRANVGQDASLLDEFLVMNRSGLGKDALKATKQARLGRSG